MMQKRFLSLYFPYLTIDWLTTLRPELQNTAFGYTTQNRNRKQVTEISPVAERSGITKGMSLADTTALIPEFKSFENKPGREIRILKALSEWCIRYSPIISPDPPYGIFLDISGCAHLWGGESNYIKEIITRLQCKGYNVQGGIANTPGMAWATARFSTNKNIIENDEHISAILNLPPAALRIDESILQRMQKLGLYKICDFINMPRSVLRRRFGESLLLRLNQAVGQEQEFMIPIQIATPHQERLSSLEPILTATGIEIALKRLLQTLCERLQQESKGIRTAALKCYRIDGKTVQIEIGTNDPCHHIEHLFQLFKLKIPLIEPALGIELFVLEATKTEDVEPSQEMMWKTTPGLDDPNVTQLLDRLSVKIGANIINRYLPDEHFWPERSIKSAASIKEKPVISWRNDRPRPTRLLKNPDPIEVTAPIPDYPPLLFRYKGKTHQILKADGPERIEREWWLDHGEHRDYYQVEDQHGQRYWVFRSGHYTGDRANHWFIHGYFA